MKMLKIKNYILLTFSLSVICLYLLPACNRKCDDFFTPTVAPLHNTILKEITDLMTPQPDSALNLILAVSDTLNENNLTRSDYYEYQILLAEALYKNDYSQVNDSAVIDAAKYYDSLVSIYPKNNILKFQQARAHYYQSVGYEEKI